MIGYYSFGRIVVNGTSYTHDIKIVQGIVVPEWRRKTGHRVDVTDVSDIFSKKPEILIFGKGSPGLMEPTDELKKRLLSENIELIDLPTIQAVSLFNQLITENKLIAAGFHLTC